MKIKTSEIAAFQALRECLEGIPFFQVIDVPASENVPGPDFHVEIRIQNRSLTILVEYKASGQPRLVREAALQIKDWLGEGRGDYGVFTAPYISPEAASVCKEAGIGYLDLAGNCLLSFETVYVHREGKPNSSIQRRELRSLYSPKAERILRVLLSRSQSLPRQRYSPGTQIAPQRCPILRSSAAILPCWRIFTSALIQIGSFSKLKWARFQY